MKIANYNDSKALETPLPRRTIPRQLFDSRLSDSISILCSGLIAGFISSNFISDVVLDKSVSISIITFVLMVFLFLNQGRSRKSSYNQRSYHFSSRSVLFDWTLAFFILLSIAFGLKSGASISRGFVFVFFVVGGLNITVFRFLLHTFKIHATTSKFVQRMPICLIGERSWVHSVEFQNSLLLAGYFVACIYEWDDHNNKPIQVRSVVETAISNIRGSSIAEVVIATDTKTWDYLQNMLRCQPLPVKLAVEPQIAELFSCSIFHKQSITLVETQRAPLSDFERRAKRTIDFILALVGLLLLLPLLTFVAIALKIETTGPVLFRQTRHGFNGQRFKILKFRTMRVLEDGAIVRQATRNDLRVTAVGRFLRRTSIDEIPQLVNILRGEMSFVGPRPHAAAHDTYYDKLISNYAYRHNVKPGLTGWAQVKGARGETRSLSDMAERVRFDLWYIDNFSLFLDIRILIMTLKAVIMSSKAY